VVRHPLVKTIVQAYQNQNQNQNQNNGHA
jgi:phosphate starvation-inducible protein PhoH